jgi:plasmid replication initiation protein
MSNENVVAKSNRLVEASYRLSLVEQQMILYAICRAREEQKGLSADNWLTIDSKAFAAAFNTDPKNAYRQLNEAAETLYDRSITMYDNDGDSRRIETRWISAKARIDARGQVQLLFAPIVIPYLTRLEAEFTTYRLEKIGKLTSGYAVRLYELLVQYASLKKREFAIVDLKKTLGMSELEYPRILDFKKWVIDIAVAQINAHTDITTTYTQERTGRTIKHLTFAIKLKPAPKSAKPKPVIAEPPVPVADRETAKKRIKEAKAILKPKPAQSPAPLP